MSKKLVGNGMLAITGSGEPAGEVTLQYILEQPENICTIHMRKVSSVAICNIVPRIFRVCTNLRNLTIRETAFHGLNPLLQPPEEDGCLTTLDLASCVGLSDCDWYRTQHALTTLDLSYTDIRHLLPAVCDMTSLQILRLHDCVDLTYLPEDIGRLSQLTNLNLSHCRLLTQLPESLTLLQKLTKLDLSDCLKLTSLPEDMHRLASLSELYLQYCESITLFPPRLGLLPSLTYLSLGSMKKLRAFPASFAALLSPSLTLRMGGLDALKFPPRKVRIGGRVSMRNFLLGFYLELKLLLFLFDYPQVRKIPNEIILMVLDKCKQPGWY